MFLKSLFRRTSSAASGIKKPPDSSDDKLSQSPGPTPRATPCMEGTTYKHSDASGQYGPPARKGALVRQLDEICGAHTRSDVHVKLLFDENGNIVSYAAEKLDSLPANPEDGVSETIKEQVTDPFAPAPPLGPIPLLDLPFSVITTRPAAIPTAHRVLKAADFKVIRELGKGGFGKVVLVHDTVSGQQFAIKMLSKKTMKRPRYPLAFSEQQVMKRLADDPWFAKLQGSFHDTQHLFFIMDYYPKGSLQQLSTRVKLTHAEIQHYAAEMVHALDVLQQRWVLHGDIKADNIFVDANDHVVLGDFGICSDFELPRSKQPWRKRRTAWGDEDRDDFDGVPRAYGCQGTFGYMAPEIYSSTYTFSADRWAFGVVLHMLLIGKMPFGIDQRNDYDIDVRRKMRGEPFAPEHVIGLPEGAQDLIEGLLEYEPKNRYTIAEVKAHRYFSAIDWDQVARCEHTAPPRTNTSNTTVPETAGAPADEAMRRQINAPDTGDTSLPVGVQYTPKTDPFPWFSWVSPELDDASLGIYGRFVKTLRTWSSMAMAKLKAWWGPTQ